jgi:hypothetical protein
MFLGFVVMVAAAFASARLAGSQDHSRRGMVYDPVLYRTVSRGYDARLPSYRSPNELPVEDGAVYARIDPRSIAEGDLPSDYLPINPRIDRVPPSEISNAFEPTGVIATTTIFTRFDGNLTRTVWAGNVGCAYGAPTSCNQNGDEHFEQIGIIIDGLDTWDGHDPHWKTPFLLIRGVGAITLTRIDGSTLMFATASGRSGHYSLSQRKAYLDK